MAVTDVGVISTGTRVVEELTDDEMDQQDARFDRNLSLTTRLIAAVLLTVVAVLGGGFAAATMLMLE